MFRQASETRIGFLILSWSMLAAIVALCWLRMAELGLVVPMKELTFFAGAIGLLLVIGQAYARREPRISAGSDGVAYFLCATVALGIASYVAAASAGGFLWDGAADLMDRRLGFDWLAHFNFLKDRPALLLALGYSYNSTIVLPFVVILALSATGQQSRLRLFLLCYVFCAGVVVALSAIFPMLGAFGHYLPGIKVAAETYGYPVGPAHLEHLLALRDGSMKVLPIAAAQGLVSFPSFHTVMSVLLVWAFARTRYLRGPALLLNALVILSTLSIGGHYLCDVIAGAVLAAASIVLFSFDGNRRMARPEPAFAGYAIGTPPHPQMRPRS